MNTLTTSTTLMVALLSCATLQGMNSAETKANAADSKSRREQTLTSVGFPRALNNLITSYTDLNPWNYAELSNERAWYFPNP
jgi:hypothetical protein